MPNVSTLSIALRANGFSAKGRGFAGISGVLIFVIFILGLPLILRS